MEYPQYIKDIGKDDCTVLDKCIYCLVQAARQYNKKAVEVLKKAGLSGGNFDP